MLGLELLIGVASVPAVVARTPPSDRGGVPLMRFAGPSPLPGVAQGGRLVSAGPRPTSAPFPWVGGSLCCCTPPSGPTRRPTAACSRSARLLAGRPCGTIPTEGLSPPFRVLVPAGSEGASYCSSQVVLPERSVAASLCLPALPSLGCCVWGMHTAFGVLRVASSAAPT